MKIKNRYLLLLAIAAAMAAAAACGSNDPSDKDKPGVEKPDTGAEICDNGIDDDEDGAIDCLDPDCLALESCRETGCTEQVPGCEGSSTGLVNLICNDGVCAPAGLLEEGALVRGNLTIHNRLSTKLETLADQNKAFLVEVYHSTATNGAAATCEHLFEAGRMGTLPAGFNRVARSTGGIAAAGTTIPAPADNIPLPEEGKSHLLVTRLYAARDLNGEPAGEMVGIGCLADFVIPPGPLVDDEAHRVQIMIQPVCDPSRDTCLNGKTCQPGALVCRDRRCGSECSALDNKTCRTVDEEPVCLKMCDASNPERLPCASGERCDTTPGERPACVPVGG